MRGGFLSVLGPACALALMLRGSEASAFEYPEHTQLSRQALRYTLEDVPEARGVFQGFMALNPNSTLCRGPGLLGELPAQDCLSLADLPALAGDHSSAPVTLFLRWFTTATPNRITLLSRIAQGLVGVGRLTAPPEQCNDLSAFPDVQRMVKFARANDFPWDSTSAGPSYTAGDVQDDELSRTDPRYICLATRGAGHFRIPGVHPLDGLTDPSPNGLGWYGRFHAQALAFARFGAQASGAERERLWGLATLYELFALHFIEDANAAGHIVSDAITFNTATVRATHNHYNEHGLAVRLPREVCGALSRQGSLAEVRFPRLRALCNQGLRRDGLVAIRARVRGDHALGSARHLEDELDVTREIALLVVGTSLKEVVAAATREHEPIEAWESQCHQAALQCLSGPAGFQLVANCGAIWELPECRPGVESQSLVAYTLRRGELAAVDLLPTQAQAAPPRTDFSGTAAEIGTAILLFPRAPGSTSSAVNAGLATGLSWFSPPIPGGLRLAIGGHLQGLSSSLDGGEGSNEAYLGGGLWLTAAHDWIPYPVYAGLGADLLFSRSNNPSLLHMYVPMGLEYGRFEDVSVRVQVGLGFVNPLAEDRPLAFASSLGLVVHLRDFPYLRQSEERLSKLTR